MSKYPQTRRSVSMTGDLYRMIKAYADLHSRSMSDVVEDEMRRFLSMPPRSRFSAKPERPDKPAPAPKKAKPKAEKKVAKKAEEKVEKEQWKPDRSHPWRNHDYSKADRPQKPVVLKGLKDAKLTPEDEAILAIPDEDLMAADIPEMEPAPEPKKMTDVEFRKALSDKPGGKRAYSPFYKHAPKKKVDPELDARGYVESPKVIEKPDTSKFDEWADKQPKAKVEEIPTRIPQSNIVLF